jgi:hypothetical protein
LSVTCVLAEALLAAGEPARAARLVEGVSAKVPDDQGVLALLDTAWRLTGDPRHAELVDHTGLVGAYDIEAPAGWSDLAAYLADLSVALDRLHAGQAPPLGQSVRHGTQTKQSLLRSEDPAIRQEQRTLGAAGAGRPPDPAAQSRRLSLGQRLVGEPQEQRLPHQPRPSRGLALLGLLCRPAARRGGRG